MADIHPPPRPSSAQYIRSYSGATTFKGLMAQSTSNRVVRAVSSSSLRVKASIMKAPGSPQTPLRHSSYNDDSDDLSTIPDPRSRTLSPTNADINPAPAQHPDLNNEVATLSNKLINAINHQTTLDDTLNATRHELETSRERIRQLELEAEQHAVRIQNGSLLRAPAVQAEKQQLLTTIAEEKRQRLEAEKEKKKMELELETLTAALFEEANKMVITAREEAKREHDRVQRKNDQLKAQLEDTETLLRSHQEQLAELKQVMEQMHAEQDDQTNLSAPPTPVTSKSESKEDVRETAGHLQNTKSPAADITPSYPTSFTNLLTTVLRTDLASYDEFISLLRTSKTAASNRVSSGSYGGLGLGLSLGSSQSSVVHQQTPSNGSTSSLATAVTSNSSPATPTTPVSSVSTGSTANTVILPPLKETRFYKRVLAEDIEPTLRLDTAPHLSWLARRAVLNAMCEGSLVVEPMPQTSTHKIYQFACSLCGETRTDGNHIRTHRFRTSESESAQRYPLCKYCLGRLRSSCDFLGFLRVVKDGHWRAEDEEGEKTAWEESVRLREQMFWCRMGGGVIPNPHHHAHHPCEKSPRMTTEEDRETMASLTEELERTGEIKPRDITPAMAPMKVDAAGNEIFVAKRLSNKAPPRSESSTEASQKTLTQEDAMQTGPAPQTDLSTEQDQAEEEDKNTGAVQSPSTVNGDEADSTVESKRLSLTIPGAFES